MWLMASMLDSTDLKLKLHLLQNKSMSDVYTHTYVCVSTNIIKSYRNLHGEISSKERIVPFNFPNSVHHPAT